MFDRSWRLKVQRSVLKSLLRLGALVAVAGTFVSSQLNAAKWCQGSYCRVYISKQLVPVVAQETPVWCWAASLSMMFGYYGHPVDQARIVSRYFGLPIPVTGSPLIMKDALNTTWTDDLGQPFVATSQVTDLYTFTSGQVTNVDVLKALSNEQPVYYGDESHAMILVQADYLDTPDPQILAGWVIDPWPLSLGFRQLAPNEMTALFLAVTTVHDLIRPDLPAITSVTNAASYASELAPNTFGSLFGKNLAGVIGTWDNSIARDQLPTTLQGTRVLINGKPAYLSYVSPTQINFLVPSLPVTGPVQVSVVTPAGTATSTIMLKSRSIGAFEYQWNQKLYAVAQPATAPTLLIGPTAAQPGKTRPALRGEFLQLYLTGLGTTNPPAPEGTTVKPPFPTISDLNSVKISFGGVVVSPIFAGLTYPGVFQVNVKVPANAPSGDIPFRVQVGSDISQADVYLTVQP